MPIPGIASWITNDDYPAEALHNNWRGRVAISWTIDETGRARDCIIIESSGYAVLDHVSCRLVLGWMGTGDRSSRAITAGSSGGFRIDYRRNGAMPVIFQW